MRLAGELDPEAVGLDLHMPRFHGVDALGQLRRNNPNVCLIAVTGDHDQHAHDLAATTAGADGVLVKREIIAALLDRLTRRQ